MSKVLEVLTEKPNMANIEDKDGATPLMFASNKGHCQVRRGDENRGSMRVGGGGGGEGGGMGVGGRGDEGWGRG